LLASGYSPNLPTMSAIGYGEIIQYLQGEISLDEAVALIKRNTRIFVRRQANWFKVDDDRIAWFMIHEDDDEGDVIDSMEAYIRRNLNDV
jgi:tRNA dimethylallyltransferase